ncbi:MAG: thymidine phosphorylase [Vicinamibacteraceae bacterium]
MRVIDIIRAKRDGRALTRSEIDWFVNGATSGAIPDYQCAALLMAIVLRGMTDEETAWLTTAMVDSGARVDLSALPGVKVDKHSTGGVGDKASLVLAPLAAACGVVVPMMSGRGLGHTGGTLDKLESIPGFRTGLSLDELQRMLAEVGCALIGQTAEIAPADRKLYALRDVTATVESVPLISASIMSKKIAEGIGALVVDVKAGSGAFMKSTAAARGLAESLVRLGRAAGVRTEALITAMDAPLGRTIGNALEVIESIETLKGRGPADLEELSVRLAARMLCLADAAPDETAAVAAVRTALASGAGLEKLRDIVRWQGGDPSVIDDYARLPTASQRHVVRAPRSGIVTRLDAERLGRASMTLGAGRDRVDAPIDPAAGIVLAVTIGDAVDAGSVLLELHYTDPQRLSQALPLVDEALTVGEVAAPRQALVLGEVR